MSRGLQQVLGKKGGILTLIRDDDLVFLGAQADNMFARGEGENLFVGAQGGRGFRSRAVRFKMLGFNLNFLYPID
jgi:hypothetical protein